MTAFNISPIATTESVIPFATAVTAFPIDVPRLAIAFTPAANATKPTPTEATPMPKRATPAPKSVKAPVIANIAGAKGPNTAPATPKTVNAPANATKPFTIDSQLMLPKVRSTGVKTTKAAVATSIAAEPAKVPFIALSPTASISIAPPKVTKLFPISSQLIVLILLRALPRTKIADAAISSPEPTESIFLGIRLTAIVTSASAPPMAVRPFAILSQLIAPILPRAEAIILIAAAISIRASPVEII